MCMSPHAQGKREKETLVSFSLLILSFFLCIVRRFPLGKLHGHFATAGIRFCRCQPFRYGAVLLFASQKMNFGVKKEVRSREPLPMNGKVENRKRFSKGFRPLRRATSLLGWIEPETKFLDFSLRAARLRQAPPEYPRPKTAFRPRNRRISFLPGVFSTRGGRRCRP